MIGVEANMSEQEFTELAAKLAKGIATATESAAYDAEWMRRIASGEGVRVAVRRTRKTGAARAEAIRDGRS